MDQYHYHVHARTCTLYRRTKDFCSSESIQAVYKRDRKRKHKWPGVQWLTQNQKQTRHHAQNLTHTTELRKCAMNNSKPKTDTAPCTEPYTYHWTEKVPGKRSNCQTKQKLKSQKWGLQTPICHWLLYSLCCIAFVLHQRMRGKSYGKITHVDRHRSWTAELWGGPSARMRTRRIPFLPWPTRQKDDRGAMAPSLRSGKRVGLFRVSAGRSIHNVSFSASARFEILPRIGLRCPC